MAKKEIEFKVLRKNSYGHRFILEPKERIKYRERCKHRDRFGGCEKGYKCYTANNPRHVIDAVLIGCTPDVSCPRCRAWDKRHGLELPYTMVENEYRIDWSRRCAKDCIIKVEKLEIPDDGTM